MPNPIPYPIPPSTTFTVSAGDLAPVIYYTKNFSDLMFVPADFIWGFSQMLAGWAAPSFSQVGLVDLREKNLSLGAAAMNSAMARDKMEQRPPFNLVGELTKSRMGTRIAFTQAGFVLEPCNYVP